MMMSATAETNTTKDPYGPSDRAYAAVKKVSKLDDLRTGEKILFTPLMKSFYFHIWRFQNNCGHGWVWDNQDYIAWELGTTKPALGRAINSLAAAGVVEIKEKERGSLKSYAYQVVNPKRIVEMGFTPPAPSRTAGMFKVDEFKATNEGSKNDGKSKSEEEHPAAVEPSTLGNDEQHGLQLTANNRGDDVSPNDAVKSFPWDGDAFLGNGKLAPGSREWAQSQGAKTWEEEIRLVWKLSGLDIEPNETQRPDDVPESQAVKQQKPEPKPEPVIEFDDTIPF